MICIPTYITISPRKDGTTAKTKCLNPQNSSYTLKPLKRKLQISSSAILTKFRVRGTIPHRRPSSLYSFSSYQSSHNDYNHSQSISSTRSTKFSPLTNLPNEIISNILFFLDYTSVQKFSRTCSQMYAVCHDNELWRKLLYADFGSVPPRILTDQDTSLSLVLRRQKKRRTSIMPPSTNLKLYQNHLKLGKRWLTGKVNTRFLQGHQDSVYCLAWIDVHLLVSGSRDKTLKIWNVLTNQCVRTIQHEHEGSILSLRVNKDRTTLLTGSSDATCTVWSLPDLIPIHRLLGHGHSVLDVCFVKDMVVTSSRDHTLRVWDKEKGTELRQMIGHAASVNAIEAIEDSYQVVSASGDATLKLWDVRTGECLRTMEGHRLGLASVRFNGKHLFSGGLEGKIKVWDIDTGECLNTLIGHVGMIRSIDCVEGKIVSGSYDRTIKVWDAETGACILSFQSGHSSWIFSVLSSGTRIVSSGQENRVMVIDFGSDLTPLCIS
ncbi:WD40-repeat-containing domain protein [Gilbertella persicaria]|uniref:WD40-repeat-containing domain protein n=1 Tax=Gilbertella persicaria TaxID=101096 RepID=UPI00221FF6C9|nr:WD40-repeat-containing domain protein [Gilbertella persicaria]KAI8074338.1 WD40-repeat-containing domain protein [Gilbertella persicaria]